MKLAPEEKNFLQRKLSLYPQPLKKCKKTPAAEMGNYVGCHSKGATPGGSVLSNIHPNCPSVQSLK